jgi:hypothetical protein
VFISIDVVDLHAIRDLVAVPKPYDPVLLIVHTVDADPAVETVPSGTISDVHRLPLNFPVQATVLVIKQLF